MDLVYIKPTIRDDWGYETLEVAGQKLEFFPGLAPHQCRNKKFKVQIRWPDQTTEICDVVFKDKSRYVSDHGHATNVTSTLPYAKVNYRGQELLVPLWEVELAFNQ